MTIKTIILSLVIICQFGFIVYQGVAIDNSNKIEFHQSLIVSYCKSQVRAMITSDNDYHNHEAIMGHLRIVKSELDKGYDQ